MTWPMRLEYPSPGYVTVVGARCPSCGSLALDPMPTPPTLRAGDAYSGDELELTCRDCGNNENHHLLPDGFVPVESRGWVKPGSVVLTPGKRDEASSDA